jgi:hypothetical protein
MWKAPVSELAPSKQPITGTHNMKLECPTCGVTKIEPKWPSPKTVTWTDDCACSSYEYCLYHRYNEERPQEPSSEVLKARAQTKFDSDVAAFKKKEHLFESTRSYVEFAPDMVALLNDVRSLLSLNVDSHEVEDVMSRIYHAMSVAKNVAKHKA